MRSGLRCVGPVPGSRSKLKDFDMRFEFPLAEMAQLICAAAFLVCYAPPAFAHQPIIEPAGPTLRENIGDLARNAFLAKDPSVASQAIYGRLGAPGEVDLYKFSIARDESIPLEVLVPVRMSASKFHPTLAIIGPGLPEPDRALPFSIAAGLGALIIPPPKFPRDVFFEPFSVERLYHGRKIEAALKAGQSYVVAVYDIGYGTGDYVVGIGTIEYFGDLGLAETLGQIVRIKMGLVGGRQAPWLDITAVLILLLGLASSLAGAAAGLARIAQRLRCREAIEPLSEPLSTRFWVLLGLTMMAAGAILLYRLNGPSGVVVFQVMLTAPLLIGVLLIGGGEKRKAADVPATPDAMTTGRWSRFVIGHVLILLALIGIAALFAWHLLVLM